MWDSVLQPLQLFFKSLASEWKVARWPQNGKKANVVPMNKKGCMFLSCHVRVLE